MKIGTEIRRLRKARGYTLNQLATLIDSDVGNLSRLERNQQGYSDATLKSIATALNVPVAAFFAEDPMLVEGEGKRLPDELVHAFLSGGDEKQQAILSLSQLPEEEMTMLLLVLQSIAKKYEK